MIVAAIITAYLLGGLYTAFILHPRNETERQTLSEQFDEFSPIAHNLGWFPSLRTMLTLFLIGTLLLWPPVLVGCFLGSKFTLKRQHKESEK